MPFIEISVGWSRSKRFAPTRETWSSYDGFSELPDGGFVVRVSPLGALVDKWTFLRELHDLVLTVHSWKQTVFLVNGRRTDPDKIGSVLSCAMEVCNGNGRCRRVGDETATPGRFWLPCRLLRSQQASQARFYVDCRNYIGCDAKGRPELDRTAMLEALREAATNATTGWCPCFDLTSTAHDIAAFDPKNPFGSAPHTQQHAARMPVDTSSLAATTLSELFQDLRVLERVTTISRADSKKARLLIPVSSSYLQIRCSYGESAAFASALELAKSLPRASMTGEGRTVAFSITSDLRDERQFLEALELLELVYRQKRTIVTVDDQRRNPSHVLFRLRCADKNRRHVYRDHCMGGYSPVMSEEDGTIAVRLPCYKITPYQRRSGVVDDPEFFYIHWINGTQPSQDGYRYDPAQMAHVVFQRAQQHDCVWCPGFSMSTVLETVRTIPTRSFTHKRVEKALHSSTASEGQPHPIPTSDCSDNEEPLQ